MTFQHVVIIMVTIVNRRRATKDCGRADRTSTEQQQYDVNRSRPKKRGDDDESFSCCFRFGFLKKAREEDGGTMPPNDENVHIIYNKAKIVTGKLKASLLTTRDHVDILRARR